MLLSLLSNVMTVFYHNKHDVVSNIDLFYKTKCEEKHKVIPKIISVPIMVCSKNERVACKIIIVCTLAVLFILSILALLIIKVIQEPKEKWFILIGLISIIIFIISSYYEVRYTIHRYNEKRVFFTLLWKLFHS